MYNFLFILLFSFNAFSQVTTVEGMTAANLDVNTNYIKNKSCLKNSNTHFATGTTVESSNLVNIDNGKSCRSTGGASGIIRIDAYAIDNKHKGDTCLASFKYVSLAAGAMANIELNGVDVTTDQPLLVSANINDIKNFEFYLSCQTGLTNLYDVKLKTTASNLLYYGDIKITKANFQTVKQSQFVGEVTFAQQSMSGAWTSLTDVSITGAKTYSGLTPPTGNRAGFTLSNLKPGRYVVKGSGIDIGTATNAVNNVFSELYFASNDFNKCGALGAGGNSATISDDRALADFTCEFNITNDTASKEVWIQTTSNSPNTKIIFFNGVANSKISVYFYPSNSDVIVNGKCVNDIQCENNFTASFNTAGVLLSQNLPWIQLSTNPTTGQVNLTYASGLFTVAPNCTATPTQSPTATQTSTISTPSSTGIFIVNAVGGTLTNLSFSISCQRTGPDYRARQNIQGFLSQTVTSSTNNLIFESGYFGGATAGLNCTTSPCSLYNATAAVLNVTRGALGSYNINFIPGTSLIPWVCTLNKSNGANLLADTFGGANINTYSPIIHVANTAALTDAQVGFICIGRK